MRKLASIRRIKEIKKHSNADALDIAIVDGWQCVVKKGQFQKDDLCVYFEIDSFLPLKPEFEFLKKSCYKKMGEQEGLRLKTMKLRGELSQGLVMPIRDFKELKEHFIGNQPKMSSNFKVSDDVSEILGVQKYEPPISASLAGEVYGNFPWFGPKTDQERIQNLYDEYSEKYKNVEFEATIKLDGSSMSVFCIDEKYTDENKQRKKIKDREVGVCSRNLELKEKHNNTLWNVFNRDIMDGLVQYCQDTNRNLMLQGELMGTGIQKNREKLNKHEFFLFDIWDIDKQKYCSPQERKQIANEVNIQKCPLIEYTRILQKDLNEILEYAEGKSLNHNVREGVVFKGYYNNEYISFKVISNKFLLKDKG